MSNTLNGLSLTAIAAETLPVLQKALARFNGFTTDFSSDVSTIGAAVSTRIPSAISASVFSSATGYTPSDVTANSVTVTLNNHKFTCAGFNDSEVSNISLAKLQQTFINPLVYGVINDMADQVYSLVTINNYGQNAYSASGAAFGYNSITTGSAVLQKSGSNDNLSVVLNPNLNQALKIDLKNTLGFAPYVIPSGAVGDVDGLKVQLDARIPSNGQGLGGFICGKDAIAIAARIPAVPTPPGGEVFNMTDPLSGLSIQLRQWYSWDKGLWQLAGVVIFGVSKGNGSSLVRFVDTSNP